MDSQLQKDTEQLVLASVLKYASANTKNIVNVLDSSFFYYSIHKKIWEAITECHKQGMAADIVALTRMLSAKNSNVDLDYILNLSAMHVNDANINTWAGWLVESRFRHDFQLLSNEAATKAENLSIDCVGLLDDVYSRLKKLEDSTISLIRKLSGRYNASVKQMVNEEIESIERDLVTNKTIGLPYGIPGMDEKVDPMIAGDFAIVAARPGMGKSVFALQVAMHVAIVLNKPVDFFSLEMTKAKLSHRVISMISRFSSKKVLYRDLNHEDVATIKSMARQRLNDNLVIYDDPDVNTNRIYSIAEKHQSSLVILDYLQLIRDKSSGSREQDVSYISRELKRTGMKLKIPVIALSQLSRKVEERTSTGHRPILSDLRESGAIEQDADTVIFLYRPSEYKLKNNSYPENIAEIIVAKQRNGSKEVVPVLFDTQINQFIKYDNKNEEIDNAQNNAPGF